MFVIKGNPGRDSSISLVSIMGTLVLLMDSAVLNSFPKADTVIAILVST